MKRCARGTMNEAELIPLGSASEDILPRAVAKTLGVQEAGTTWQTAISPKHWGTETQP